LSFVAQFGEVDDRRKLMAITYNNMSCLFKRKGLLKTALGYAEKVLSIFAFSQNISHLTI
jgi:hypothetical protein